MRHQAGNINLLFTGFRAEQKGGFGTGGQPRVECPANEDENDPVLAQNSREAEHNCR